MHYLALCLAQFCTAGNIIIAKNLTTQYSFIQILFCKFLFSSSFLLVLSKGYRLLKNCDGESFKFACVQSLCSGILFNSLCYFGLRYTNAAHAGIIISVLPCIVAVFAVIFLKEKLRPQTLVSLALMVAALVTLQLVNKSPITTNSNSLYGMFIIFLALLPEATFTILGRKFSSQLPFLQHIFLVNFIAFVGATILMVTLDPLDMTQMTFSQVLGTLCMGMFTGLYFAFWLYGLKKIPASKAALFFGLFPIASSSLSVLFLGENFSIIEIFLVFVVVISILIGNYRPNKAVVSKVAVS